MATRRDVDLRPPVNELQMRVTRSKLEQLLGSQAGSHLRVSTSLNGQLVRGSIVVLDDEYPQQHGTGGVL